MARRKKYLEEQENHERWLVSYADFITLLFAFFVVMYSISSVNEGKYRVLSETLNGVFKDQKRSMEPIQVGELARSPGTDLGSADGTAMIDLPEVAEDGRGSHLPSSQDRNKAAVDEAKRLGYIAGSIESVLANFIDNDLVEVHHNQYSIEVSMRSKMLFRSGSANLSDAAVKALVDVSKIVKNLPNPIHVKGYTDNIPIRTTLFPSNWELSAARAASVVHLFSKLGVDPNRLAAIGFGQYRPVADNRTESGRQKNRRVSLIILTNNRIREEIDLRMPAGRSTVLSQQKAAL